MPDTNLDVPGTFALADEIVALLVHSTLLDGLVLRVWEVSRFNVRYHFVRYAS